MKTSRRQFLRSVGSFLLSGTLSQTGCTQRFFGQADKPNVILIMADDLGYECLSCNGGRSYQTPNLDKLAQTGMRFTDCYVNPLCTPTRVALMTGLYNSRNYARFGTLPHGEKTFGHMMQKAGYKTCVVGKWQLGDGDKKGQDPKQAGFDEHFLKVDSDSLGYADPKIYSHQFEPKTFKGAYGPDLFYDYISDFIDRHQDKPFFLYYPMFLTHFDFKPTPDSEEWKTGDRHEKDPRFFKDMVAYMDKNVGRIVRKLEQSGLRGRTLLIFLGDNGTQSSITSKFKDKTIKGGKSWLTDAGTHVPLIANWPGVITEGQTSDALVDPTDLLPTIAETTGASLVNPSGNCKLDGKTFLPVLQGIKAGVRDWIVIEYIREHRRFFRDQEGRYVRDHRWKLYDRGVSKRGDRYYKGGQLFDKVKDPDEQNPIESGSDTKQTAEIRSKFQAVLDKTSTKC